MDVRICTRTKAIRSDACRPWDFIAINYYDTISAEELSPYKRLAAIACMGQTKLRASFKQAYGSTITAYIQSRRIAFAEYLLVKTDFPIGQVAEAVGYHHGGRFAALFKNSTGLSPEEYRHMMRRPDTSV